MGEPILETATAEGAVVTGLCIRCPVCEDGQFEFGLNELEQDDFEAKPGVEYGFAYCDECGAFVDCTQVRFGPVPPE